MCNGQAHYWIIDTDIQGKNYTPGRCKLCGKRSKFLNNLALLLGRRAPFQRRYPKVKPI